MKTIIIISGLLVLTGCGLVKESTYKKRQYIESKVRNSVIARQCPDGSSILRDTRDNSLMLYKSTPNIPARGPNKIQTGKIDPNVNLQNIC